MTRNDLNGLNGLNGLIKFDNLIRRERRLIKGGSADSLSRMIGFGLIKIAMVAVVVTVFEAFATC